MTLITGCFWKTINGAIASVATDESFEIPSPSACAARKIVTTINYYMNTAQHFIKYVANKVFHASVK